MSLNNLVLKKALKHQVNHEVIELKLYSRLHQFFIIYSLHNTVFVLIIIELEFLIKPKL